MKQQPALPPMRLAAVLALLFGAVAIPAAAQPPTDTGALLDLSRRFHEELTARRTPLYEAMLRSANPAQAALNANRDIRLQFIREGGMPVYTEINNLNAARTLSTDDVWPGGGAGISLTGSGTSMGMLGVWDAGGVRLSHDEFQGRASQMDSPPSLHYHSTHVAGTLIGAGLSSQAKGMSYQANLAAYDWDDDASEMAAAAASGMNVSSHSYGYITGWYYSSGNGSWYWYGDITISPTEDYTFGLYEGIAQAWDEVAYAAPYYTIVKSAGNDRDDYGPGPGSGHYVYDPGASAWVWSTDSRDIDGGPDGYDSISYNGTAKNILTIGAVDDISGGYASPGDVIMSVFSGWGPTDDGRIKPDFCGNGISLYSTDSSGDTEYRSLSGTSMSTPNCAGSLNLLVRHHEATHGGTPLASTMKAVLMQTADEAGPAQGPDYAFGWGLINTRHAAELILADSITPGLILEESLADGETDQFAFQTAAPGPIRISIAWTDPPGTPPATAVDPADLMLVNDLDLRLERMGGATYPPFVLDPANPSTPAATGDNFRDNAEQIDLLSAPAGTYRVTVGHKGSLGAPQAYSIVCSRPLGPVVVPESPAVAASEGSCVSVLVEWTTVAAADSFEVKRDAEVLTVVPSTVLAYSDTVAEGSYLYAVSALNAFGRSAPGTDEGSVLGPPAAPTSVAASDTSDLFVRIEWTASPGAEAYRVFRDDSLLVTLPAQTLAYSDTVGAGTYLYGIAAGNACGFSGSTTAYGAVVEPPSAAPTAQIPRAHRLFRPAPNPGSSAIRIGFEIPVAGRVDVSIFDAGGRLVVTLADRDYPAGSFLVTWSGRDEAGREAPAGAYFARMTAGSFSETGRLVLLR